MTASRSQRDASDREPVAIRPQLGASGRARSALLGLVVAAVVAGCSGNPPPPTPSPTEVAPPTALPDTTQQSPEPTSEPTVPAPEPAQAPQAPSPPPQSPTPTPQRPAPTPQPPPSPPPPPPELRLELSEAEKAALLAQAKRDLDEAERLISVIDREHLTTEQKEKLQTVESLVASAKTAEEKGDIPGRANLARKARLLAEELVPG